MKHYTPLDAKKAEIKPHDTRMAEGNQPYLERPRINRLLEKAVQMPIVAVIAGAGYGKSLAVYSLVRKLSVHTTWVQFSEGDNISSRFWEKFVSAISVVNKKSADKLAELGFPGTERQFRRYMSIPKSDIVSTEKYIFIYDDIHLIKDRAVLEFIGQSITTFFPNLTSIIISRNELPMDLSRAETRGKMACITEEDLRFTKDEAAAYLGLLGLRPSMQTLSAIYDDTEGWAFALHLAGLSLKHSKDSVYVPQSLRVNIFHLIESEVVSPMSEELKKFLVKLSLIEHPVPDLLREIAGGSKNDYSLIDEMEQISSFIQYDTYLNGYRIHHLFLDYLTGKQGGLSEDEKREVWSKAACWCLRNNHKIEAIQYYEKAEDYAGLLDAMYSFPLAFSGQVAELLLKSIEQIPEEIYTAFPEACINRARLLLCLGMFDRAKEEITANIAWLEGKEVTPAAARTLAGCYNNLGFLGYLTCIQTRDYSYVQYFEKGYYYSRFSGHQLLPPVSVMNLGSYNCRVTSTEPGEMERYNDALDKMTVHISASMNGCGCGMNDLAWAELAFFKGDLSRAEELAKTAAVKARERQQYEIEHCATFYLIRINLCRGNGRVIPDLLAQTDALLNHHWYLNRRIYYDIVYGWFYIQTGSPEKIAPWLKSDFEESDLNSMNHGIEIMVKAKYHFAAKRYPAALADLESREDRYGTWSFVLARLEAKVLESLCRYRMNNMEGAFQDLEAAWMLAQSNGLIMPFAEMGKDMRALAGAALKHRDIKIPKAELEKIKRGAALYAKNIFGLFKMFREEKKPGSALSRREQDVLAGLAQGLTRQEIAGVSGISVNTVKSTVRSVYNKLGAVNRADAVRIASEMGMLS
jgi:LuxR family maltose regulon positive regulatory protein